MYISWSRLLASGRTRLGSLSRTLAVVYPALLGADPGEDLFHRLPEAQGAVGDGQEGVVREAPSGPAADACQLRALSRSPSWIASSSL